MPYLSCENKEKYQKEAGFGPFKKLLNSFSLSHVAEADEWRRPERLVVLCQQVHERPSRRACLAKIVPVG